MYDELIARIRYHIRKATFMGLKEHDSTRLLNEAADAIEELQGKTKVLEKVADHWCSKAPKWIPVTERLPENGGCLVSFLVNTIPPHRSIDICYFAKNLYKIDKYDFVDKKRKPGFYQYDSEYGYYERTGITHWMPLPQPPESEDE